MTEVKISVRSMEGGCSVIAVEGGLDAFVVTKVKDVINDLIANGSYRIVLDMEGVKEINSTALGILVSRLRRVRLHGGDIKLARLREGVRKVFDVMGASRIFEIFEGIEEAVGAFEESQIPPATGRP